MALYVFRVIINPRCSGLNAGPNEHNEDGWGARSLRVTTPNHEFFVVLVLGKSTCALTFSGNIVEVLLPLH